MNRASRNANRLIPSCKIELLEKRQLMVTTPIGLAGSWNGSTSKVSLTWNDVSDETGYAIQYAAGANNFSNMTEVDTAQNVTSAQISLSPNTAYTIQVFSKSGTTWSSGSSWINFTAGAASGAPSTPGTPTTTTSGNNVAVSWTASTNAATYNVQRFRIDDGSYTEYDVATGLTGTSTTDFSVPVGQWTYKVLAINANGYAGSSLSSTVTIASSTPTIAEVDSGNDTIAAVNGSSQGVAAFGSTSATYAFTGTSGPSYNNDYFKITATTPGQLTVNLNTLSGSSGTYVAILDGSGNTKGQTNVPIDASAPLYLLIADTDGTSQSYTSSPPTVTFTPDTSGTHTLSLTRSASAAVSTAIPVSTYLGSASVAVLNVTPPAGVADSDWFISTSGTSSSTAYSIAGDGFNDRRSVRVQSSESLYLWLMAGTAGTNTFTISVTPAQAATTQANALADGVDITNWFRYTGGTTPSMSYMTAGSTDRLQELWNDGARTIRLTVSPQWLLAGDTDGNADGDGNGDSFWDGTTTTFRSGVITDANGAESVLNQAVDAILAKGFKLVLCLHGFEQTGNGEPNPLESADPDASGADPSSTSRNAIGNFALIWENLSRLFSRNANPDIYFELLNEPQFRSATEAQDWDKIQDRLITTIRGQGTSSTADDVNNTVVSSGNDGSLETPDDDYNIFATTRPSADQNVIYTFHFYDSVQYTGQGSSAERYNGDDWGWFHDIVYPYSTSTADSLKTYLQGVLDLNSSGSPQSSTPWTSTAFKNYMGYFTDVPFPITDNSRLESAWNSLDDDIYYRLTTSNTADQFNRSSIQAEVHQIAASGTAWNTATWCGEYGAAEYTNESSAAVIGRQHYFDDVHDALNAAGISGAVWGYDDPVAFGIGTLPANTANVPRPSSSSFSVDTTLAAIVFGDDDTPFA